MSQSLLLSAMGDDRTGLLEALVQQISQCGCSITDSRVSVMDGILVFVARVGGTWDTLARLEAASERLERSLELDIHLRRVSPRTPDRPRLPYSVDIVGRDRHGTLAELLEFFQRHEVVVAEVVTQSFVSDHTGTSMATVQMNVHLPDNLSLAMLREEFMELCDRLNLDGMMEPVKH